VVTRVLAITVCCVAVAACEKRSELYCTKNPEDLANCEQTDAASPPKVMCISDSECSPAHCELVSNVCVECLDSSHCDLGEVCDVNGTFSCRGCINDADCGGNACLPGGSCGSETTVLYVDPTGSDENPCTVGAKCATIAHALTLADADRHYLRLTGELTESPTITVPIEILGDGATLNGVVDPDWVIKIQQAVVRIYGLTIFCAGGTDQTGVKTEMNSTTTLDRVDISGCGRNGAVEMKSGVTIVTRSNIHDNVANSLKSDSTADFTITNNFIHHNTGPIEIGAGTVRPETKFEFNTVADNATSLIDGGGMICSQATVIPNNVFVRNGGALAMQVTGCDASGSLAATDAAALMFTDAAAGDYHIGAASSAKDLAPDGSTVDTDYDGQYRPQGPAKDYGADEFR
jgi:Right handed beta helix region